MVGGRAEVCTSGVGLWEKVEWVCGNYAANHTKVYLTIPMIPSGWVRIALLLIPYHTIPFYSTLFHDNQSHFTNYHVKETSKWVGEIGGAVMSPTCNCAALKLV